MTSMLRAFAGRPIVRRARANLRLFRWYAWPPRLTRLQYLSRRLTHRWKLVHQRTSAVSGLLAVWDLGRERRLVFGRSRTRGTQSIIHMRGSWAPLRREFWGQALLSPAHITPSPRVLILGLGGGTMVHLTHQIVKPSKTVVVELDPDVVDIARRFMGIDELPDLEIIVGDALVVVKELLDGGTSFDLIIDDIFGPGLPDAVDPRSFVESLVALCSPQATMVFNRFEKLSSPLEALLGEHFESVQRKEVNEVWRNDLVIAGSKRVPPAE